VYKRVCARCSVPAIARPVFISRGVGWVVVIREEEGAARVNGVGEAGEAMCAWTVASTLPLMP
jgi:hypothetical protein